MTSFIVGLEDGGAEDGSHSFLESFIAHRLSLKQGATQVPLVSSDSIVYVSFGMHKVSAFLFHTQG